MRELRSQASHELLSSSSFWHVSSHDSENMFITHFNLPLPLPDRIRLHHSQHWAASYNCICMDGYPFRQSPSAGGPCDAIFEVSYNTFHQQTSEFNILVHVRIPPPHDTYGPPTHVKSLSSLCDIISSFPVFDSRH
jgi:hypothetical protein